MSRILKAYRTRFHQELSKVHARRLEQGVDWLVRKAERLSKDEKMSLSGALTRVAEELATRSRLHPPKRAQPRTPDDIVFFCDAGLGGLARWLRAAGYRALWEPGIADDVLLRKAKEGGAAIVTTDSMLMERRVLRDGAIRALWLPPTLSISEQLARVFREFELSVGRPRCMSCGGQMIPGDKEKLKERIPRRTYHWLNEFFICASCGKLFWHGTHWQRIVQRLNAQVFTEAGQI